MTPVIVVNERLLVAGKLGMVRLAGQAALGVGVTIACALRHTVLAAWLQRQPPRAGERRRAPDALRGMFLWAMIVTLIATAWAPRGRRRALAAELAIANLERSYAGRG